MTTSGVDAAEAPSTSGGQATPSGQPPRRSDASRGGFRDDIQALRALAVAAVLLYHLWPNRLTGGFIGVDIFFVISGFLITAHLLEEVRRTGRIRVGRFWARRAKRLLPASLLVLAVTAVGVIVWVPRTSWPQYLQEVVASVGYVQNWFLAASSVEYLAADNTASPVQHFWTLSVEEQFYVGLPLLLLLVVAATRHRSVRATTIVIAGSLGLVTLASFAYSVVYTAAAPGPAYFSTLTRAWEFGAGALIAMLPSARRALGAVLPILGVGLITVALLAYDGDTVFPGAAAALPVVGAMLVAWAGRNSVVAWLGRVRPVAWLGRISYAVYLWHWPLIVLLPAATGRPLSALDKIAILAATLALAWLSTAQWEDRIRFSPRLLGTATPRRVAAVTVAAMLLAAAVPAAGLVVDAQSRAASAAVTAEVGNAPPACFGAEAILTGCHNPDLDGMIVPAPANARDDDDNRSACWSRGTDPTLNLCPLGPSTGYDKRLLAVGDSHNNSLIAAYERIATERNWRIDVAGRAGCYWTTADLTAPTEELAETCRSWRAAVAERVREADGYSAVLVTKERKPHEEEVVLSPGESAEDVVVQGMVEAWRSAEARGIPVLAITDNPRLDFDVLACAAEREQDPTTVCSDPVEVAYDLPDGLDAAVQRSSGSTLIDTKPIFCTDVCDAIVGGALVYRDNRGHVTATYARSMAPELGELIAAAVEDD